MPAAAPVEAPAKRAAALLADKRMQEMRREFTLDREGIDKEARTVPLSFASNSPVERWFGYEVLDISKGACDLTRLENSGAILVNHDWDDQVGVCLEASIDAKTGKARCVAKFGRSQRATDIFNDIVDGIRSLVSVGYIVRKMVLQSVEGDVETHRVTDWQPFEVSIVSVPADPSVGVGRSKTHATPEAAPAAAPAAITTLSRTMPAPADSPVVTSVTDISAERQRVKDINAAAKTLAERHPAHADAFRNLAAKCAETGDTMDAFNRTVLNDILATKQDLAPVRQDPHAARLGLKPKDIQGYRLMDAIRAKADGRQLEGAAKEFNDELTRKLERQPIGFFIPDEVLAHRRHIAAIARGERTLYAGSPADGGFTVSDEVLAQEFITFLRSNTVLGELGARTISGLRGDISIPRQLTGATAYWVSETGSITASSATFGQVVGKPRRVGTSVPYTKQFIAQTSLDAESFVIADSDASTAAELDRVGIRGAGGSEPLGMLNLASGDVAGTVSFSAAATWPKYLSFFQKLADAKALLGDPAFITSPAAAVKAMSIAKFANTANPIWDENNKIGPWRARWSNNISTSGAGTLDQVIFADVTQALYLEWAGRDVVVDPYGTNATAGTVTVTIQRLVDFIIRRAKSVSYSTDSGAQ